MRRRIEGWRPGRITVVRADGMGDALLTVPLLRALTRLPWVTGVQFVGVPVVAQVLATNLPEVELVDGSRLARKVAGSYRASHRAAEEILRHAVVPFGPEIVLAPRSDHNDLAVYELVARSNARITVGYVGPVPGPLSRHEALASAAIARVVFDVALRPDTTRHEAALALGVAEPLGVAPDPDPDLDLVASAPAAGRVPASSPGEVLVVVAPVAGAPKRDWPLARYAEVLRLVAPGRTLRVLVAGGAERDGVARELAAATDLDVSPIPAPADLDATLAVMRTASCFLGADSGPAHLAAAAGLPGVVVSCHPRTGAPDHSNAPNRFRPLEGRIEVLQPHGPTRPCTDGCAAGAAHCILGVTVEAAATALAARIRDVEEAR